MEQNLQTPQTWQKAVEIWFRFGFEWTNLELPGPESWWKTPDSYIKIISKYYDIEYKDIVMYSYEVMDQMNNEGIRTEVSKAAYQALREN
ncbi:MAG: hypothetical protein FWE45_03175 [Firmicutes bacterium]|nr:hypothetical protein [Bacillota bacterium]